uniref:Selenoprotein V n=1 Tax=Myotis lucifugus TaxID=59463 RepID=G1PNV7_MYOLU
MNHQARASHPFPARTPASVRASIPFPTPVPASTPVRTSTPVPASTPVQTPTRVPAPAPARTSIPVPAPAPARTSTTVPAPVPFRTPTPVPAPAPVRTSTPVPAPAPVRTSTPVPAPVRTPTPVPAPAQVRTSTPVPAPAQNAVPVSAEVPDWESFLRAAPPPGPPPEPAPERPLPRDQGPSVTEEPGRPRELLPALHRSASDLSGPTRSSSPTADPAAAKLTDPTAGPISMPILGPAPFATFLPISTNTFASTSEYFQVDKRIVIRVTYCYNLRYILLKKSLEQQFPNCLYFEEDISEQATGEFEVFVDGKLVHSKKKGDGFVDEVKMQKIVNIIDEEIRKN